MQLIFESERIEDYLGEVQPYIRFDTPLVKEKIKFIESKTADPKEKAKLAFEIARDEIHHSFDTKEPEVTISAEAALKSCNGICFAKSHLLATLLRGMNIPCGFCYQRVLRKTNDPNSGHALHGLNAVYLKDYGWFRLDPRGNKAGVDSQFSIETEKLAYPIRPGYGEIDYPNVFVKPLDSVIRSMESSKDTAELFFKRPEEI